MVRRRRSGFAGLPKWSTRLGGAIALGILLVLAANSGLGGCGALASPAPTHTTKPPLSDPIGGIALTPPLTTAEANAELTKLRVAGRGPLTGYNRDEFGPAWSDDVAVPSGHNGCDTRNDMLRSRLRHVSLKPGTHNCVVQTGVLTDPYTGHTITFNRSKNATAIQIDHIVPLAEAWRSGASAWTSDRRRDLANDPTELTPVDGKANEAKGDSGPDSWRPANRGAWCWYATAYISVKSRYHLSVQASEKSALLAMLKYCH